RVARLRVARLRLAWLRVGDLRILLLLRLLLIARLRLTGVGPVSTQTTSACPTLLPSRPRLLGTLRLLAVARLLVTRSRLRVTRLIRRRLTIPTLIPRLCVTRLISSLLTA